MLDSLILLYFLLSKPGVPSVLGASSVALASHSFSLENRYGNEFVNDVFKDNILLALSYMDGDVKSKAELNWDEVRRPSHFEFTLEPNQRFTFHDNTLPEYSDNIAKTTNARFIGSEGFKSDGDLIGDGVCHIASLIYWVANDAGLETYAPSDHNFAVINEVPKEYGVGIMSTTPLGNLYIKNNLDKPVTFLFDYDGVNVTVSVVTTK